MNKLLVVSFIFLFTAQFMASKAQDEKNRTRMENQELFDIQKIFFNERFPNIVVATDGTLVATWGNNNYRVRRSEDGGQTWGEEISVSEPGFQGGGTIVDETTGDILIFVEDGHPISPLTVYRSKNHGKTWKSKKVSISPDINGNVPAMHMNERGTTLMHGEYAGRLIRPTRYYAEGNKKEFWGEHYTNAIYSDDHGKTWHTSQPFPANGTGEATLVELSDGTIYYNSRRHHSTDGLTPRKRYSAWSTNGGETWVDMMVNEELPDGDQNRDYGLMGGLASVSVEGHDILLFSNIDSPEGRTHGTVWASFDGGKTWPVNRLVYEGSFAYSSMVVGRENTPTENTVYLFFESDGGGKVARFNLAWLMNGKDWRDFLAN